MYEATLRSGVSMEYGVRTHASQFIRSMRMLFDSRTAGYPLNKGSSPQQGRFRIKEQPCLQCIDL